jgi:hypothetical protein
MTSIEFLTALNKAVAQDNEDGHAAGRRLEKTEWRTTKEPLKYDSDFRCSDLKWFGFD